MPVLNPPPARYVALDGLRGLAAYAVFVSHLTPMMGAPDVASHGYLAVDFFFMLSGFVIAHAYRRRLDEGLSLPSFLQRRAIRLYPMAALGGALGLIWLVRRYGAGASLPTLETTGALNLVGLPVWRSLAGADELFPGNPPFWSLFFEVIANLAWAGLARRLRLPLSLVIAGIGGLLTFHYVFNYATADIGFGLSTWKCGLARVAFGFFLGVVVHDLGIARRFARFSPPPIWLALALAATLCLPGGGKAWDLAAIFAVMPALLILGAGAKAKSPAWGVAGELSYPLYTIHYPILAVVLSLTPHGPASLKTGLVLLAVVPVIAWTALKLYDEPLRAALARKPASFWSLRRQAHAAP